MTAFPLLFAPFSIRQCRIKNRIVSTGHDTLLPTDGVPNAALVAYHAARARGGAGLIILQVAGVHDTARYTSHMLMATSDTCIEGYRAVVHACAPHDTRVFGQLFHPGREIMESQDGSAPVAYAPSAIPNQRFHVMPRELTRALIADIIAGYASAAGRLAQAGLDGVEVVASHGYLPAQFLNPRSNRRDDDYGGSIENRLRFTREVIAAIRDRVGPGMVIGLRISAADLDYDGIDAAESLEAMRALAATVDYFNITLGSSASFGGAIHIAPPMALAAAYVAPFATRIKAALGTPLIVAGRINQPQDAERILASGGADLIGMTRAMICDPEMPNKAHAGQIDDIRACIACNQACIGHFHAGYPISCIQHPESGRELIHGTPQAAARRKKILIAGGGPAGLKAAAVAAARGHEVTLYEAGPHVGGQVLLAQRLPGRAEFGGLATNLTHEARANGAQLLTNTRLTRALIDAVQPDAVIIATGARARSAMSAGIEGAGAADSIPVVDAWSVITDAIVPGKSVVIADWRGDWIGMGLAEKLARGGCRVRLCVDGYMAGQRIHQYVRDHWAGVLHQLGVEVIPYARLFGVDSDTVYFQHAVSMAAMGFTEIDTVIAALGHEGHHELEDELNGWAGECHLIGDCQTPRSAEEAVLDALQVASRI